MLIQEGDRVCLKCGGVNGHEAGCSGERDQEFEVISAYGRKQAIEDGVLVDCTQPPLDALNRDAGIKVHVAMTAEAFDAYVHPLGSAPRPIKTTHDDNSWELTAWSTHCPQLPRGQDMAGRYWDIVRGTSV